jgi:prefoldin subunit 5
MEDAMRIIRDEMLKKDKEIESLKEQLQERDTELKQMKRELEDKTSKVRGFPSIKNIFTKLLRSRKRR